MRDDPVQDGSGTVPAWLVAIRERMRGEVADLLDEEGRLRFAGPPGTGKTLCAEIVAGELGRPLRRVTIPEVVSKWVGETEKHIKRLLVRDVNFARWRSAST